jgi:hypothetical protein
MEPIKTRSDLEKILKFLEEQGFGYHSDYDLHNKKIDHIIGKRNTLGILYDTKFKEELYKYKDYEEADKKAKKYFSGFSADDKIFELISSYYLQSDEVCKVPGIRPDNKEIIEWVNFKIKYGIKNEFGEKDYTVSVYNLDKNFLKINFKKYIWDFKRMYKLIFVEDCKDFDEKYYGSWQNIGKIEIKFFQNGSANIKGDTKKLKEYYYKNLKSKKINIIIKYNDKLEIINKAEKW